MKRLASAWRHVAPHRWLVALLAALVAVVALAALWQWHGRAHQVLDVGAPLDDGAVLNAHAREVGQADPNLTFRWTRQRSELRLWALPSDTPAVISLRMLPPPETTQQVTLTLNGAPIGPIVVRPGLRTYQVLAVAPPGGELALGLTSARRAVAADGRGLGVALDQVAVRALGGPTPAALLRELGAAPLLPLGLGLLAAWAALIRLPPALVGGLPALLLLLLLALDQFWPLARLRIALYPAALGIVLLATLPALALLRRLPGLWPRDERRALAWLVAAFVLALALTFIPAIKSDGLGYYVYLRSLAVDHDLNFGNEYREWPYQSAPSQTYLQPTPTGHYVNFFSIGPALFWSPFYGAAHLLVRAAPPGGPAADGYAQPYIVLATFGSALAGLITMLTLYRICRRWCGPAVAALAVLTLFAGSNLLYYAMREGGFAHALSAMTVSLYVLAWLRLEERPGRRRWLLLGLCGGLMVVTYWVCALLLLLAGLTWLRLAGAALRGPAPGRRTSLLRLALDGAGAALLGLAAVSPQLVAWRIIYGAWLTVPQGSSFVSPRAFRGWEMLFAPLHGLLPWTPALLVGLLGLALLWRRARWLAGCLLASAALFFLYNALLPDWHGSGAFGLRRLTALAPWSAVGLALLFTALHRVRPALPVGLAALLVGWSLMVMLRYDLFLIPHSPPQLRRMPLEVFYLSRETFPLWALEGWLRNSYIWRGVSRLLGQGPDGTFLAITLVMAVATTAVALAYGWLTRRCADTRPEPAGPPALGARTHKA